MKSCISIIFTCVVSMVAAKAGVPSDAKSDLFKPVIEQEEVFDGKLTLGARASRHLNDGYADLFVPIWKNENHLFFFNSRATANDDSQELYSFGGGWRYLVPDRDIILGANVFYDYLESAEGNHFDQLGLGAEILTRWVDARFNYYRPDDSRYLIDSKKVTSSSEDRSGLYLARGGRIQQDITVREETRVFENHESALEGCYGEAGFLVPYLERYVETRIFGGYYAYENPFGNDLEGFKARAEMRVLPGVTVDVEYYEDAQLMGGNWVGGLRASMPFDFGNLFTGKNPFEGIREMYTPGRQGFASRMTEMVIRSPRIKNVSSGLKENKEKNTVSEEKNTETLGVIDQGKGIVYIYDGYYGSSAGVVSGTYTVDATSIGFSFDLTGITAVGVVEGDWGGLYMSGTFGEFVFIN